MQRACITGGGGQLVKNSVGKLTLTGANTYTDLNGLAALKNSPASPQTIRAVSEQVEALFFGAARDGLPPRSEPTCRFQARRIPQ